MLKQLELISAFYGFDPTGTNHLILHYRESRHDDQNSELPDVNRFTDAKGREVQPLGNRRYRLRYGGREIEVTSDYEIPA